MKYTQEPLSIKFRAPKGKYEVTATVYADSDTVFKICIGDIAVSDDIKINRGQSTDVTFNAVSDPNIDVYIYCDGAVRANVTATPHRDC